MEESKNIKIIQYLKKNQYVLHYYLKRVPNQLVIHGAVFMTRVDYKKKSIGIVRIKPQLVSIIAIFVWLLL